MALDVLNADSGDGAGIGFHGDTWTQDGEEKSIVFHGLSWGPTDGPYSQVLVSSGLPVNPDPAASPQNATATSASLAVQASVNLDSTQITSAKTGFLRAVVVWSARAFKAEIQTVTNGSGTNVLIGGGQGVEPWQPSLPGRDYIKVAHDAGAGLDGFRVTVTNLDPAKATDVYASFFWDEVTT